MKSNILIIQALLFLILVVPTNGFGQQTQIDSLKQVISTAREDTNKVKTLNKIASKYQQINLDTSLIYAEQSLKLAQKLNYKKGMASAFRSVGLIYYYRSNFAKVLENWEQALSIYTEIDDKPGIARIMGNIGIVYDYKGDYPKAIEYYQQSLNRYTELGDKDGQGTNLGNLGIIYMLQGNYSKAISYYNQAINIYTKLNDKRSIAINLGNIGVIYNEQSNYPKALEKYKTALIIYKKLKDPQSIAAMLSNLGNINSAQSNYPKALEYYQKALKINNEIKNKDGIATNLGNMGIVYQGQNNQFRALEYYQKALKISNEIDNKDGIALNLSNIGSVYYDKREHSKSLEYYQKALKINTELGDKRSMLIVLGNIGISYKEQANYPKAIEYLQKALNLAKELDNKTEMATVFGNIAGLYNNQNNYNTAIEYSTKSLKTYREIGILDILPYEQLSISYWALNNTDKAANNLDTLININNKNILLNFSILSENTKQLYFARLEKDYWRYSSFVLQNKDDFPKMIESVYNNTLKNKGLLLKSNTAMRTAIYSSRDSVLIEEYNNWIMLKRQISKKYSTGEDVSKLENKADSLEGYLVKNSNEFSDFKKIQNISWQQVQASLKDGEVAIEFTHFPLLNPDSSYTDFTNQTQYIALILTKNSNPKMIPLFEEKQLEQIIGKFGGNNYSYINSIYGKNTEVNQELYNLIWQPMEANFKGARKVYLSPSGLLHKISFSAIAKEQNVYLCDAYDIEVKSSTGKITESKKALSFGEGKGEASLFGGITYDTDSTTQKIWSYLEGTETETQKIDKILKKGHIHVDYYSNTSATEEEFKLMASNSNILHIATHGFFYPDPTEVQESQDTKEVEHGKITFRGGSRGFGVNSFVENQNPLMRSGLVFAGANDVWSKQNKNDSIDDGVLTAQEVSNIDMRKTNLVVMSACETGLGDIKGSEGVYGLQRAFKMAGVDYMIMSLWQVPDKETEEFMTNFYKKLIKHKDIKKAFAKTQKEMRIKYDPYFWAAFVLIE